MKNMKTSLRFSLPSLLMLTVLLAATASAVAPNLIITEFMKNPSSVSDANGEYIEIFNNEATDQDIDGYILKDDGSDLHTINNGGPLVIPAGGYIVLGRDSSQATNGGYIADYQYSGFTLANGTDEIVLVHSDTVTEVDRVNYSDGSFPDPTEINLQANHYTKCASLKINATNSFSITNPPCLQELISSTSD